MTTSDLIAPAAFYRRIATEEAFITPELHQMYRELIASGGVDDPGFNSLIGYYLGSTSERARNVSERLQDLGDRRIADMDATGIDMQIISLTSPGVQVLKTDAAVAMARLANDQLAEAIRRHPTRFAGLVAIAPQDPAEAAKEIERGVTKLGMKGVIINSHTQGEYLDNPKFWPIFEAAEALRTPVYLHPNTPPPKMIDPFLESGLDGAIYGFAVETGLHALRIITSGVFDRFPNMNMILGHLGEALPFWMFRLDYMHRGTVMSKRYDFMKPLQKKISDYLRENIYYTTSGMAWEPAISFTQSVVGMDRVMYAMDYPYEYVADEVRTQDALPISDADKKKFYQTTAERVFKL
jgi:2,3-dihydroxybenzoate decarboxylase